MTSEPVPRYHPQRDLPRYSYVTGLFPHPTRDERGHSFGHQELPAMSLDEGTCRANETYLYALDLFNHGFYWEAHEAWETLWHAAGRRGRAADFLKGLIKLAAAGVKAREGRPAGVRQHAQRAKELLVGSSSNQVAFDLPIAELQAAATSIAEQADLLAGDGTPDASRKLPLMLRLVD